MNFRGFLVLLALLIAVGFAILFLVIVPRVQGPT